MKPTDAERDMAFERLIARGLEGETDVTGRACPDADLLAAWFDRSLSAAETERIEAHASGCASCQQILADLARSEPEVVRAAPQPAPARPWHWHWRWLVPAATAAVVIVLATRPLRAPSPDTPPPDRLKAKTEEARASQPSQAGAGQQARAEAVSPGETGAQSGAENKVPPPAWTRPLDTPPPPQKSSVGESVGARSARAAADALRPRPQDAATPTQQVPQLAKETPGARADLLAEEKVAPPRQGEAAGIAGATVAGLPKGSTAVTLRRSAQSVPVVASPPPPAPAPAGMAFESVATKAESATVPLVPAAAQSPTGKVAWRVGANGSIERSTDGLATWNAQASGVKTALAAASAPSDSICWAVGAGGTILRTTDGATWQRVTPPTGSDLVLVRASSEGAATVRASDGSEYSTSDGGRTWTKRQR